MIEPPFFGKGVIRKSKLEAKRSWFYLLKNFKIVSRQKKFSSLKH